MTTVITLLPVPQRTLLLLVLRLSVMCMPLSLHHMIILTLDILVLAVKPLPVAFNSLSHCQSPSHHYLSFIFHLSEHMKTHLTHLCLHLIILALDVNQPPVTLRPVPQSGRILPRVSHGCVTVC